MVMMSDPMREMFNDAAEEGVRFGYARRGIQEFTQLANTPDRERGSVMSTALSGLAIFRNSAVRNRTSHSTFHISDLRGMRDPKDGTFKPVYVYLSINYVEADAVNPITAIFIELMSKFLIANKPDDIHGGTQLGPYPVLFVLAEFPKMQKLTAVIQGPDVGRGQEVSYLFIGQDINQIQEKYGDAQTNTIISTTAAKIILRQNDVKTAETFSKMIGEEIKKDGDNPDKIKPLFTEMDIRTLDEKKQLVIFQGFANRPIEADKQPYYNTPDLKKKVLPEAPPLPEHLVQYHIDAMGYDMELVEQARKATTQS
jgi:type IV secretory pathway TraG/TraD family ATPase VirD4